MFTEFELRSRWIVVPLIACAFLVASIWAGAGPEDMGPSKNTGLSNPHKELPGNDAVAITAATKTDRHSGPGAIVGGGKVVSGEPSSKFATSEFSFGTARWPQQSAGAYGSRQSPNIVATAPGGLVEKGLAPGFSTCRENHEVHHGEIPEANEACGIDPLGQFRWDGFYQHLPTSQGSVLVNF